MSVVNAEDRELYDDSMRMYQEWSTPDQLFEMIKSERGQRNFRFMFGKMLTTSPYLINADLPQMFLLAIHGAQSKLTLDALRKVAIGEFKHETDFNDPDFKLDVMLKTHESDAYIALKRQFVEVFDTLTRLYDECNPSCKGLFPSVYASAITNPSLSRSDVDEPEETSAPSEAEVDAIVRQALAELGDSVTPDQLAEYIQQHINVDVKVVKVDSKDDIPPNARHVTSLH